MERSLLNTKDREGPYHVTGFERLVTYTDWRWLTRKTKHSTKISLGPAVRSFSWGHGRADDDELQLFYIIRADLWLDSLLLITS